jgi:chitinase
VYDLDKYNLDLSGHPLAGIGDDIKHCQLIDVPVSLSIGGFGTGYSLRSSRQVVLDLFNHLWNAYNGGLGKPLHLTTTLRYAFPPTGYLKCAVDTGIFERVNVRIYDDGD